MASKTGRCLPAYELATFVAHNPLTFRPTVIEAQGLLVELENSLPAEATAEARARAMSWTLDDAVVEALGLFQPDAIPAGCAPGPG
ncbi:MAG: hypothetical protein JW850_24270 [Thermoflexales bacterium]|nr:hypothetical protein [Thermoflexales bacterium]